MRQTFHLLRGPTHADETFRDIVALAARIHSLRKSRPIQLTKCHLARVNSPSGDGVALRFEDELGGVLGHVFFPETRAYVWPGDREALSAELRRQKPDLVSQVILDAQAEEAA